MDFLDKICLNASKAKKHIVLPEGEEDRIIQAAMQAHQNRICRLTLLGKKVRIRQRAEKLKVDLNDIQIIDPEESDQFDKYTQYFYLKRKHKGISEKQARETMVNPLYFGAMMVDEGMVNGGVAGSINTTGNVLRAGIQCIGLKTGITVVSSTFLMIVPGWKKPLTYADAAVVPNPDPEQLASIAVASAYTHQKLTGEVPFVAMLSFSTLGSANHPMVDKIKEATQIVKKQAPNLNVDGEMQVDTALIPSIAKSKAPESFIAGKANVLIFPDLNAGNIGYKLTERLANAKAMGPLIQGLKKPFMDLSRGCSVDDIVNVVAICCVLSD
jgi:phosphate acetyltransferase